MAMGTGRCRKRAVRRGGGSAGEVGGGRQRGVVERWLGLCPGCPGSAAGELSPGLASRGAGGSGVGQTGQDLNSM